jgi:hypothetical protein
MNPYRSNPMSPSISRLVGRVVALLAAAAIVFTITTADARADTYSIVQCSPGGGAPDGWVGSYIGAYTSAVPSCGSNSPLAVRWDDIGNRNGGDRANLTFTAAPNTVLTRVRGHRTSRLPPDAAYASPVGILATATDGFVDYIGGNAWTAPPVDGWIDHPLTNAHSLSMEILCSGSNACQRGVAAYTLDTFTVTALDTAAPTLSGAAAGSMVTDATLHAAEDLTVSATDAGSGVYRLKWVVDGVSWYSTVVDANGGRCADVNTTNLDAYEFAVRVPCKLSVSGTWAFDTSSMTDGQHNVKFLLEDAAGNDTTAVNRIVAVDNQPATVSTPEVSGTAVEGQSLVCQATAGGQSPQITYEWLRAGPDGSGQEAIAGAHDPAYTLQAADAGRKVRCRVTATDLGGSATATSSLTSGPFDGGHVVTLAAPVVSGVAVTGAPVEGQALTCQGAVAGTGASTQIQWLRAAADGSGPAPIGGANARSYLLVAADVGHRLLCSITAHNDGGTVVGTSDPAGSGVVAARTDAPPGGPGTNGLGGQSGNNGNNGSNGANGQGSTNSTIVLNNTTSDAREAASRDLNVVPVANPDGRGDNGTPVDPQAVVTAYFKLGTGAAARTATAATAKFSQRLRIMGRLKTHDGRPIVGAKLYLAQTTGNKDGSGNPEWKLDGGTVTKSDGSFLLFSTAAGRNRQARLVYFPYGGRVGNRGSNALTLSVSQDASLSLSRRQLHNGRTLAFSGRVRGTVRPGTVAQLQVKLAAGWSTFRSAKVSASGRYAAHWKFRRTTSRTTYRFRVRIRPGSGSGYVASTSSSQKVVVSP